MSCFRLYKRRASTSALPDKGNDLHTSIHVPEVRVLSICKILESVSHAIVLRLLDACCGYGIPLIILSLQVPPDDDDDEHEQYVASQMGRESNEVARRVP